MANLTDDTTDGQYPAAPFSDATQVEANSGLDNPPSAVTVATTSDVEGVAVTSDDNAPLVTTLPVRTRAARSVTSSIVQPGVRTRLRRPDLSPALAASKPLPWPLKVVEWIIVHRGFWLGLVAIVFAFLGQRIYNTFGGTFQEDYGDAPKYYLIGCSLIVIAFLFTYRTKVFFRRGTYQPPTDGTAAYGVTTPTTNNFIYAFNDVLHSSGARRLLRIPWWRFALLAGAAGATWAGVQRWRTVPDGAPNANDLGAILYWVLSIVLVVLACARQRFDVWPLNALNPDEYADSTVDEDGRAGDEGWVLSNHRLEVALVVGIIIFAAFLRLYNLGSIPTGMHGDEAEPSMLTRQIMHGNYQNMPLLGAGPWYNMPALISYVQAPGMMLFGDSTVFGARFMTAVSGVFTVFFMYLLLRLLFKGRVALIGATLLAVSDVSIHFSHYAAGIEEISACWVACFYFLYKGLRTKRYLDFVWSGLAGGLSLYFYPSSRLIAVLLVMVIGYMAVTRLTFVRDYWTHIGVCVFAMLIIFAPMLSFTLQKPEIFNARMRDVYITYGGAADQTFGRWNIPLPADPPYNGDASPLSIQAFTNVLHNWNQGWSNVIWHQTRASFLALNAISDRYNFYETGQGLLGTPMAILTILGMAYFLWRWRDPRYMLFNIWFWPAMFIAVAMTINSPDVLRMAGLPPAWVVFPAVLLNKLAYEAEKTGWFIRPELREWMRRRRYSLRQLLAFGPAASPALVGANAIPVSSIDNMLRAEMGNVAGYHPPAAPASSSITRLPVRVVRPPRSGPAYLNILLVFVVMFLGFQTISAYFNTYAQGYHWVAITTPPRYMQQLGPDYYVYYMGMHQYYFGHGDIRYMDPNVQGNDFWNPPDLLPIHDDHGKESAFFIFPYHAAFLPIIQQFYPNGKSYNIIFPPNGGLAFTNYVVPLSQVRASEALTATYYTSMNLESDNPGTAIASSPTMSLTNAPRHTPATVRYPASVRWEGGLYAPAYGVYNLELSSADAQGKPAPVALYLDGQEWLKLDGSTAMTTTKLAFAQGWHNISLRAALPNASQRVSLRWRAPAAKLSDIPSSDFFNGPLSDQQYGLTGEYSPAGQAISERRVDPFIGFTNLANLYQANSPFDITWRGNLIVPTQDNYNFSISCVGPVTLKIDDQTVLSGGPNSGGEQSVGGQSIALTPGPHKIELSYHWQQDFGSVKLYWNSSTGSVGNQLIPPSALRPAPSIWNPKDLPDHGVTAAPTNLANNANRVDPAMIIPTDGTAPFVHPQGIGVDPQGNIFVGDDQPPHVYKFDKTGKQVADWPVLPDSPDGKARLIDLAVDNKGQVYVLDPVSKNLEVYDNNGKLISHRNANNKFAAYGPNGLMTDKADNVYLSNTGGNTILEISPQDKLVREYGGGTDFPDIGGKINPQRTYQPIDATITDDGSIYTVDLNQRIIEYSNAGKYVREWKMPNIGGGEASLHMASYKNFVYLSDNAAGGVYILDTTGDGTISLLGGPGSDPGLFQNPSGLATDAAGRLYVADRNNSRVQIFNLPQP